MENKKLESRNKFKKWLFDVWSNPKKRFALIAGLCLFIALIAGGIGFYFLRYEKQPSQSAENNTSKQVDNEAEPKLYEAVLDGALTSEDLANRHPLAVIVENHPDARPQAGLDKASIVYEAIAEGGITRFMAVFGENDAEKVGPIRSARTYYVDWAHGLDAFFAHVGGNMDALDKINAEGIFDLDQFKYPGPYQREYTSGIATEHTMFSNTAKLWDQAVKNGYSQANNFNRYKFKDEPAETEKSALPESQKINITFSNSTYNVYFEYDKATNTYKRYYENGKPHVDKITKKQIEVKNLIVMDVKRKPTVTRINEPGYDMTTIGSGNAKIFIDGKMIEGTWKKTSKSDRELFYDSDGNEIIFNRGQFWIAAVPPENGLGVTVE